MSVVAKKLAWNDIKDLPESHGRTEIVDGELVMSPTPGLSHQRIGGEYSPLGRFGRGQEVETRVLAGLRLDANGVLGAPEQ